MCGTVVVPMSTIGCETRRARSPSSASYGSSPSAGCVRSTKSVTSWSRTPAAGAAPRPRRTSPGTRLRGSRRRPGSWSGSGGARAARRYSPGALVAADRRSDGPRRRTLSTWTQTRSSSGCSGACSRSSGRRPTSIRSRSTRSGWPATRRRIATRLSPTRSARSTRHSSASPGVAGRGSRAGREAARRSTGSCSTRSSVSLPTRRPCSASSSSAARRPPASSSNEPSGSTGSRASARSTRRWNDSPARELVERLDRRPGQKEERYRQLLGGDRAGAPQPRPPHGAGAEARVAALEAEVARLVSDLEQRRRGARGRARAPLRAALEPPSTSAAIDADPSLVRADRLPRRSDGESAPREKRHRAAACRIVVRSGVSRSAVRASASSSASPKPPRARPRRRHRPESAASKSSARRRRP